MPTRVRGELETKEVIQVGGGGGGLRRGHFRSSVTRDPDRIPLSNLLLRFYPASTAFSPHLVAAARPLWNDDRTH